MADCSSVVPFLSLKVVYWSFVSADQVWPDHLTALFDLPVLQFLKAWSFAGYLAADNWASYRSVAWYSLHFSLRFPFVDLPAADGNIFRAEPCLFVWLQKALYIAQLLPGLAHWHGHGPFDWPARMGSNRTLLLFWLQQCCFQTPCVCLFVKKPELLFDFLQGLPCCPDH